MSGEAHAIDEMPEEGEVKCYMVGGEKVPAVLSEDGATYTTETYKYSKILSGAVIGNKRIFKMKWEPTWVEEEAIEDMESVEQFMKEHEMKKGKKKNRRSKRGGVNHQRKSQGDITERQEGENIH